MELVFLFWSQEALTESAGVGRDYSWKAAYSFLRYHKFSGENTECWASVYGGNSGIDPWLSFQDGENKLWLQITIN